MAGIIYRDIGNGMMECGWLDMPWPGLRRSYLRFCKREKAFRIMSGVLARWKKRRQEALAAWHKECLESRGRQAGGGDNVLLPR